MSDTQSPEKDAPKDERAKEQAKPAQDTDVPDAAWSEEILEWAIASSTCGGLPRKKDDEEPDAADEEVVCP